MNKFEKRLENELKHWEKGFMSILSGENSVLMDTGIYNPEPLPDLLERLYDDSYTPSDSDYVNLILKYLFAYINPDTIGDSVPLQHIDILLKAGELFFYTTRYTELSFIQVDVLSNIIKKIMPFGYSFSMLGDIKATSELVKSIIESEVCIQDGTYVGLDLGTGSGILLLTQYIQARRKNSGNIINYGVETDFDAAKRTQYLAEKLGFGTVVEGDSTDSEVIKSLGILSPVSQISNECIPNDYIHFFIGNDPYIYNIASIRKSLGANITESTAFFPFGLEIMNGKSCISKLQNQVHRDILSVLDGPSFNPKELSPGKIMLNSSSNWKRLEDVGNKFSSKVKNLLHWRDRWVKMKKAESYVSLDQNSIHDVATKLVGVKNKNEVMSTLHNYFK